MTITLGSLFDGSGGFPLAGCLCGIVPLWASEIEPYPIAVTRSRFPGMEHLGDISKINGAKIKPVDIITFGSPCQDLSVAGKRAGLKHESNGDQETTRSGLFMEAIRIIKEMRGATNGNYPRFALWENVPGAFSSNGGEDFRVVLEEFIKIIEPTATMPAPSKGRWPYADAYVGDRWSLAYRTFDAQYWGKTVCDRDSGTILQMGTPQRRRRIYLVADFAGGCAPGILFECESLRRDITQSECTRERTAADVEKSIGANDLKRELELNPSRTYLFENHWKDARHTGPLDVCTTLPAYLGTGGNNAPLVLEEHDAEDKSQGVDGYNSTLTGNKASTLGVNCGMSTGRNGVLVPCRVNKCANCKSSGDGIRHQENKNHAIISQNDQCLLQPIPIHDKATRYRGGGPTRNGDGAGNGLGIGKPGDPFPTLSTCDRHAVMVPHTSEYVLDDQGGTQISVRKDGKSPTLRAEMHGNIPCVMEVAGFKAGNGAAAKGIGWQEGISPALTGAPSGTNQTPAMCIAFAQNQRNEVRDLKGIAGAIMAQPGVKQQTYICEPYCMAHGQVNAETCVNKSPCLNCNHDQQIVFESHQYGGYREGVGSLRASGGDYGGGSENLVTEFCDMKFIVRRLTPIECARLQGFLDHWGYP